MATVAIRGGTLIDGTGVQPYSGDLLISDDRIVAVGQIRREKADQEIDATDRYVAPGFIDAHVHADSVLLEDPHFLPASRQGVTTLILGQDGCSFAPGSEATVGYMSDYFAAVNGRLSKGLFASGSIADFLRLFEGRSSVNVGYLVPHGNLRMEAIGPTDRPATADELAEMASLLRLGLSEGAVGMSTGLEYVPGSYADTAELAYLGKVLASAGVPLVSHMRHYGPDAPQGLTELIEVATQSGVAVHASHLRGPAQPLITMIDTALGAGLDVTFDSYPYIAASTSLSALMLPGWAQEGGIEQTVQRLRDESVRRRLAAEVRERAYGVFERMLLSSVANPEWQWSAGLRVSEAAAKEGKEPFVFACDLLVANRLEVGVVRFGNDDGYADEDSLALLVHAQHVAGSDGIFQGQHPHPRGWGAFGRYLGTHVRTRGDYDWVEAVAHLSTRTAERFGLQDRGKLSAGFAADVVVFDPREVCDRATYERPTEPAHGVDDVLVNGVAVLRDGTPTVATPGHVLRPPSSHGGQGRS